MLPFLKSKKAAGVVGVVTKADGESVPDHTNEGMVACAEEIISAIAMKDATALASALQSCFSMMDAEPQENADFE